MENEGRISVLRPEAPDASQLRESRGASPFPGGSGSGGDSGTDSKGKVSQQNPRQPVMNKEFDKADPSTWTKIPRNASCPCGSGKKYKHCHGRLA